MAEEKILIKLENLSCGYGKRMVLEDINFQMEEGEFIGIIGPNGAGKSTLLKTILRIIPPLRGRIFFKEKDISQIPRKLLAQEIAYVPQQTQVWFSFSVEEILRMGRYPFLTRYRGEGERDWKIIQEKIKLTGIENLFLRNLEELSSGERQMVFITRALIQEPKLLLLDEPTAHLDIGHEIEIFDLLYRLNREDKLSIIVVLHDLNLASQYCDRLIILFAGRIEKSGKPQEVLDYRTLEKVYETVALVKENPITQRPHIFIIPEKFR
ncbi:MAG: ABC transporter ATP-binding protein [Candidatus Omnitrophica bacterium]|nr:ABC transporter ATP-binding protein [Candidatus Omnitrophota bacterium]MCM8793037.1 ABC transporter ATP-binding protein [Candidatus Omnitrophota bacterium]